MGAGYGNHDAAGPADAKPDAVGQKPAAGGANSAPPAAERRDISTPGAGSLPDDPQGDETDPATD